MSGINPNYKGCVFCGQEECDCPYTGKEGPDERIARLRKAAAIRYRHFCKKCGLTWFDDKEVSRDCDCKAEGK